MLPARLLALYLALAPTAVAAAVDGPRLQLDCAAGQATSCMELARAQTGVGLPVDLLAARSSYEQACRLGASEGCQGAQGISRYLGRHVELSLVTSVPRVWPVAGPGRAGEGGLAEAPAGEVQAVLARLPFAEACYRSALEDNTQLEGLLDLSLLVSGGRVGEVVLHQSNLGSEDAARCIADAVGRAALPAGSADGELFVRLRAEPAPAADLSPPVVQDHLADGAQSTIGDPSSGPGDRRIEIALTVAVRQALGGTRCVLGEVESARWDPVTLKLHATVQPDGTVRGLRVEAAPPGRQVIADCVGSELQALRIGQTGYPQDLDASLVLRVAPTWTATIVP